MRNRGKVFCLSKFVNPRVKSGSLQTLAVSRGLHRYGSTKLAPIVLSILYFVREKISYQLYMSYRRVPSKSLQTPAVSLSPENTRYASRKLAAIVLSILDLRHL